MSRSSSASRSPRIAPCAEFSIVLVVIGGSIPILFFAAGILFQMSKPYYPQWDKYGETNPSSPYYWLAVISLLMLALTVPALFIIGVIEGTVLTRRYGWRAVSDPIERQRIAMREALYDVATGSTRAEPEHDGERIIIMPTRRLRPVGAPARADRRTAAAARRASRLTVLGLQIRRAQSASCSSAGPDWVAAMVSPRSRTVGADQLSR